jgi:uncharacterized membrane protein YraQ (UPF0718 family)
MALVDAFIDLFVTSAPWLLFGLLIAGLMKALIPTQWVQQQLGSSGTFAVIKAAFIGAPLPLCSCGVVPAALGVRRAGASKSATVSFLVATPETGPDSISLSYALLGPFMAVVRPIAAIVSAIAAGLSVGWLERSGSSDPAEPAVAPAKKSCCSKTAPAEPTSCCSKKTPKPSSPLVDGLGYAFGKLLADISGWLLLGIAVAAVIQAYVPASWLAEWGDGISAMLLMTVIGIPMYICASASTPIAAGFLAAGISPGAVLVFMLAGPATNIGTLGIIKKELGGRALIGYLTGVIVTAWIFGLLTNYLATQVNWVIPEAAIQAQHDHMAWYDIVFAIVLALVMVYANRGRLVKASS